MRESENTLFTKLMGGSLYLLLGTFLSLGVGFLAKTTLIRAVTQNEYGLYTLALTLVNITITFSTLGLENGVTRYIAYLRGKNECQQIQSIIIISIAIGLIMSTFSTIVLIFLSETMSTKLFHTVEIHFVLKLLAIVIPFAVLINILMSIFRGFNQTNVKVYFYDILRPTLYFLLINLVISFGFSFNEFIYSYIISTIITFVGIIIYFLRNSPIEIKHVKLKSKISKQLIKSLILFSLPLLLVNITLAMMSWTDTLMLGNFEDLSSVGQYDAAFLLASLLSVGISSIGYIYIPIVSKLYGNNLIDEIKNINIKATKLCFTITLPIFFTLFVYPEFILNLLFGLNYVPASSTLQILAVGFIFNSYFGFNYHTLMALGKSNYIMYCSLLSVCLNIMLNFMLIPKHGIIGAAFASASSFILIEFLMTQQLAKLYGIHPFSNEYIHITIISVLAICISYILKNDTSMINLYLLLTPIYGYILKNTFCDQDLKLIFETTKKVIQSK